MKIRIYERVPDCVNEAIRIRLSAAAIKIAARAAGAQDGPSATRRPPITRDSGAATALRLPPAARRAIA